MYTFPPNKPDKGIYTRPTPELERWVIDSASTTLFGGIFAKSPYPETHQANVSQSCKPPETSANTIPPGFEQNVAAEGWPEVGESIFSTPKPGLSETELRDLLQVLHARGGELLESVKHSLLAENQSTPSPAKVPSDRTDPPSPTEWRECRGGEKPTTFACDDPSFDEVRRLHEMTSDLDSRVRSLLLESPVQPPQPDPVEPDLYASNQQHGQHLLNTQLKATGHQQERGRTLEIEKNPQTSSLPDSKVETSVRKPQRSRKNQAQRRQIDAQPEIPYGPISSMSRNNNTYHYQHRGPQFTFPPTGPQKYGAQYPTNHRETAGLGFQNYEASQGHLSQGQFYRGPLPIQHANGFQARPTPRNQRLYEPGLTTTNSYLQQRQQNQVFSPPVWASINAQIEWLNKLAQDEITRAEITRTELVEKDNLRLVLEVVCREVVSELERSKDGSFDPSSVALKSFGSVSSGFATHSSDMDLVLLSPNSHPDPASADSEIPRMLEKRFLELGHGAQLLTRTRVPIIKFCEKPTPELLEVLRLERTKWEEYQLRQADREHIHQPSEPQQSNHLRSPPASVEHSSQQGNPGPGNSSSKSEDRAEQNQDYSPEALAELYEMAIRDGWYNDLERGVIRQFMDLVKQHRADHANPEIIKARLALDNLPDNLRRYRRKQGFCSARLEFPKTGVGIHCDINFSNLLALHNTRLLRCYCLCDPRVRDMALFVKAWAKRRKINSAYHGTLSSYGYVLMVLHFLVNVATPPVVPNLQLAWKPPTSGSYGALLEETSVDGYDVRFWRNESEITQRATNGRLTDNKESVGSLLRGFFGYFAHQGTHIIWGGFAWGYDVLSLRTRGGIVSKQSKGWVAAKTETLEPAAPGQEAKEVRQRYLFAIEDPFEHEHNIARTVVHHGIVAIRDEFRRAYTIIQRVGQGGVVDDLFAEAPDRKDFQRKRDSPKKTGADAETQQIVQRAASANSTDVQVG